MKLNKKILSVRFFIGCLPHTPGVPGEAAISSTVTHKGHWVKLGPESFRRSTRRYPQTFLPTETWHICFEISSPTWKRRPNINYKKWKKWIEYESGAHKYELITRNQSFSRLSDSFSTSHKSLLSPILFLPSLSPLGIPPPPKLI